MTKGYYTEQRRFTIYVLISSDHSHCFVGKARTANLRTVYERHYFQRNAQTAEMVQADKDAGNVPEMYVLDRIETTENIAYKHIIAWARYFVSHLYEVVNRDSDFDYALDLDEHTQRILDEIKDRPLDEVCNKRHQRFGDYGTKRKAKSTLEVRKVTISLTPEEYAAIEHAAEDLKVSVTHYVKEMAIYGYVEDFSFMHAAHCELVKIRNILQKMVLAIYRTNYYRIEDIARVQHFSNRILMMINRHDKWLIRYRRIQKRHSRTPPTKQFDTTKSNQSP